MYENLETKLIGYFMLKYLLEKLDKQFLVIVYFIDYLKGTTI